MKLFAIILLVVAPQLVRAECIPISAAKQHIGETKCVTGKVVHVKTGVKGVHYLDFCDDYRTCPFTVVIFPGDLKHVGDVKQLERQTVEIHGSLKGYGERAEIILKDFSQFGKNPPRLPPLPKDYDVERRGKYSAGMMSHGKRPRSSNPKKQTPTLPIEVPEDEN